VEEGIVCGGGVALLRAWKTLDGLKESLADGTVVVFDEMQTPFARNAGNQVHIMHGRPRTIVPPVSSGDLTRQ
jgi:hypothetical protein